MKCFTILIVIMYFTSHNNFLYDKPSVENMTLSEVQSI